VGFASTLSYECLRFSGFQADCSKNNPFAGRAGSIHQEQKGRRPAVVLGFGVGFGWGRSLLHFAWRDGGAECRGQGGERRNRY